VTGGNEDTGGAIGTVTGVLPESVLGEQMKPVPSKPSSQAHENEPTVFEHVAFAWQGSLKHSLTSEEKGGKFFLSEKSHIR
jgi:hypothetical protein